MFAALSIVAVLAVGGLAACLYQAVGWRRLRARRIVVNLKTGQALDGFLTRQVGQLLFIRGAMLLGAGDEPIAMDGEVIVERSEIEFIQSP